MVCDLITLVPISCNGLLYVFLGKIVIFLGVCKLHILAVGDCFIDLSTILVFVCKNLLVLAKFQHIDGLARW